jgi:uncharacterized Tic20 family protein
VVCTALVLTRGLFVLTSGVLVLFSSICRLLLPFGQVSGICILPLSREDDEVEDSSGKESILDGSSLN